MLLLKQSLMLNRDNSLMIVNVNLKIQEFSWSTLAVYCKGRKHQRTKGQNWEILFGDWRHWKIFRICLLAYKIRQ